MRDPYELLDLDRSADTRAVKRAYRRLAKRYHPDAARDDGHAFVVLRTAYETLSDPDRRMEWDRRHPSSGRPRRDGNASNARSRPESGSAGNGHAPGDAERISRPRDRRGRFVRPDVATPWWEEIRGARSVGVDLPGARGDPHLGPSSSGAAWSSAARAYFRRLTRQDSAAAKRRVPGEGTSARPP